MEVLYSNTGTEHLHIVVVGQNFQSKCYVAETLAEISKIRAFFCRQKFITTLDTTRTVKGHGTKVVITHNINTPLWTRQKEDIKKLKLKVLLYIEDNDCVDIPHGIYMMSLRHWFQCNVLRVRHNIDQAHCGLEQSLEHCKEYVATTDVTFCSRDSRIEKSEKVAKILAVISNLIERKNVMFSGAKAVGDKSNGDHATREYSEDKTREHVQDNPVLDSVVTNIVEDEFSSLPMVDESDWELFGATLEFGTARSNQVRVNVVGNQEAGKTTLVERLRGLKITCPDRQKSHTEGLDINNVTSKCIERDGRRIWSTDEKGYENELNLQRMAFALQKTEQKLAEEKMKRNEQHTTSQTATVGDAHLSSDIIEDDSDITPVNVTYGEQTNMDQKKFYLQSVKHRRDKNEDEGMYISYWDFAGQSTYYSTHQAFLAPSAVYLLVFDLSVNLDTELKSKLPFKTHLLKNFTVEETLKFWVSSIKAYTRDEQKGTAPFIIVGTHRDKVTPDCVEKTFGHIRKALKDVSQVEFIAIDNTRDNESDRHLQALKDKILDLGLGVIDEEIPAQWINLERALLQKKQSEYYLTLKDVKKLDANSDMPINDNDKLLAFLEHEHRRGFLMQFKCGKYDDLIILDPSILANFFNILLRQNPNTKIQSSFANHDGVVLKEFVRDVAKKQFGKHTEIAETILAILEHLYIVHDFGDDQYIVPCLLPTAECQLDKSISSEKFPALRLSFENAFIPPSFFHLLLSAMNDNLEVRCKDGKPLLFNLFASFVYSEETRRLNISWHDSRIYFELKNYSKQKSIKDCNTWKDMMKMIDEKIKKILSIYRRENVRYCFEIECPLHDDKFVNLTKIRAENYDGEAMCPEDHAVTWSELCLGSPAKGKSEQSSYGTEQNKPTHSQLGRLSRCLSRENTKSLAAKLRLKDGNTLAERAAETWPNNPDMQRFQVLVEWHRMHPEHETTDLLESLSESRDHDYDALKRVMEKQLETRQYDLAESVLKSTPDESAIARFSNCVGNEWHFLISELGFSFTDIEMARANQPHDHEAIVRDFLFKWTQMESVKATTQRLLDTALCINVNQKVIEGVFK